MVTGPRRALSPSSLRTIYPHLHHLHDKDQDILRLPAESYNHRRKALVYNLNQTTLTRATGSLRTPTDELRGLNYPSVMSKVIRTLFWVRVSNVFINIPQLPLNERRR